MNDLKIAFRQSEFGEGARAEALRPVTWDEWITLPVRPQDNAVQYRRSFATRTAFLSGSCLSKNETMGERA